MEKKLYVGNLSYDATREDVQSLFENHGTVSDVFIVKDRESGRPRGFAFVTMETKESMDAAIEALNGEEFMGRNLAINEARPRDERSRGGDGGYRGGGDRSHGGGDRSHGGGDRSRGRFNERRGNDNRGGHRNRRDDFNEGGDRRY